MKCCFCKKECGEYGNNPYPANLRPKARCCDFCNHTVVMPIRVPHLAEMFTAETFYEQQKMMEELRKKAGEQK